MRMTLAGTAIALLVVVPLTLSATASQETEDQPMEIVWLEYDGGTPEAQEDNWYKGVLEEKFGVTLTKLIHPRTQEAYQTVIASGDFPDVASSGWGNNHLSLFEQGLTRGIPVDMIREHDPNYAKLLDERYPYGWFVGVHPDNPDEQLALFGASAGAQGPGGQLIGWRHDWAASLGFALPDYEQNKVPLDDWDAVFFMDTSVPIGWLEELLIAFRDGDPDGNGKNDTIPLAGGNSFSWTFAALTNTFGVTFSSFWNVEVDGELYTWRTAPGWRDFLAMMARWYEMGLIDSEFPTVDLGKTWEKVTTDQTGVYAAMNAGLVSRGGPGDLPPGSMLSVEEAAEPGVDVVIMWPPTGPDGLRGIGDGSPGFAVSNDVSMVVNKDVSDAKLQKILEIHNFAFFGEEYIHFIRGMPGVHFDWSGEPYASYAQVRDPEDVPDGHPKYGPFSHQYYNYTAEASPVIYPTWDFTVEHFVGPDSYGQRHGLFTHRFDLFGETEYEKMRLEYGAALGTIEDEFFYGVVTGEIDLDAEWDDYLAKWRRSGGDEILAEMAKMPLVSGLKEGIRQY